MGQANLNENEALDVAKVAVDRDQAISDSGQVRIPKGTIGSALIRLSGGERGVIHQVADVETIF
jgi:hypothetical protein